MKRYVSFGFAVALTVNLIMLSVLASAFSGSGTGSLADPYIITNCTQLQEMNDDLSGNYTLGNDVDCSGTRTWNDGRGFLGIGTHLSMFEGSLDGHGHTIDSLFANGTFFNTSYGGESPINITSKSPAAFINYTNGDIKNLVLSNMLLIGGVYGDGCTSPICWNHLDGVVDNVTVSGEIQAYLSVIGGAYLSCLAGGMVGTNIGLINASSADVHIDRADCKDVGGFVGGNAGIIINCTSSGQVRGRYKIGGFVSVNLEAPSNGEIQNCSTDSALYCDDECGEIGGFVGSNENGANIDNSYAMGNVTLEGTLGAILGTAGGFAGANAGIINNSYASGDVLGIGYLGGFVGWVSGGTIANSYASGSVYGNHSVAGFAATNDGAIKYCYADGESIEAFNSAMVAGFVDYNLGVITDSYAMPGLVAASSNTGLGGTGGFVGKNEGTITNCYAQTRVDGYPTSPHVGLFVGWDVAGTITDSYYPNSAYVCGWCDECTNRVGELESSLLESVSYLDTAWEFPPWSIVCDNTGVPPLEWQGFSVADCVDTPVCGGGGGGVPVPPPVTQPSGLPSGTNEPTDWLILLTKFIESWWWFLLLIMLMLIVAWKAR